MCLHASALIPLLELYGNKKKLLKLSHFWGCSLASYATGPPLVLSSVWCNSSLFDIELKNLNFKYNLGEECAYKFFTMEWIKGTHLFLQYRFGSPIKKSHVNLLTCPHAWDKYMLICSITSQMEICSKSLWKLFLLRL